MAKFAKLSLGSKVVSVHCIADAVATTEQAGIDFLNNLHNYPFWKQTFNDGTRKNDAAIGYIYDEDRDAFITPKPFTSWVLNESTCVYEAPTPRPDDGKIYNWNESTTSWDEVEL